eukprot:TRINITY_DN11335_c0_g1_i3.p2 TRINITY_DN11335_c0_g1~~TRINITY_DN11335_c0_g1_i3.p2  ORF type:complete len:287 (-),score=13.64 TRINITY_DN11335_c0_g1_i3:92-928(-)
MYVVRKGVVAGSSMYRKSMDVVRNSQHSHTNSIHSQERGGDRDAGDGIARTLARQQSLAYTNSNNGVLLTSRSLKNVEGISYKSLTDSQQKQQQKNFVSIFHHWEQTRSQLLLSSTRSHDLSFARFGYGKREKFFPEWRQKEFFPFVVLAEQKLKRRVSVLNRRVVCAGLPILLDNNTRQYLQIRIILVLFTYYIWGKNFGIYFAYLCVFEFLHQMSIQPYYILKKKYSYYVLDNPVCMVCNCLLNGKICDDCCIRGTRTLYAIFTIYGGANMHAQQM